MRLHCDELSVWETEAAAILLKILTRDCFGGMNWRSRVFFSEKHCTGYFFKMHLLRFINPRVIWIRPVNNVQNTNKS